MTNKNNNNADSNYTPSGGRGAYNFLFKPVFFILSLVFATWLVLYIEKLAPSDFGKYGSSFKEAPSPLPEASRPLQKKPSVFPRSHLKKMYGNYKAGLISQSEWAHQLELFLESPQDTAGGNTVVQ